MTPSEGKCGIINILKVFKFCFCASGSKASVSVFFSPPTYTIKLLTVMPVLYVSICNIDFLTFAIAQFETLKF